MRLQERSEACMVHFVHGSIKCNPLLTLGRIYSVQGAPIPCCQPSAKGSVPNHIADRNSRCPGHFSVGLMRGCALHG